MHVTVWATFFLHGSLGAATAKRWKEEGGEIEKSASESCYSVCKHSFVSPRTVWGHEEHVSFRSLVIFSIDFRTGPPKHEQQLLAGQPRRGGGVGFRGERRLQGLRLASARNAGKGGPQQGSCSIWKSVLVSVGGLRSEGVVATNYGGTSRCDFHLTTWCIVCVLRVPIRFKV